MNPTHRYRLADGVAIRPERFGGLVYNYHNRQLYFLHSHDLTEFIRGLKGEDPLAAAIEDFRKGRDLPVEAGETMLRSVAALERIGLVVRLDG